MTEVELKAALAPALAAALPERLAGLGFVPEGCVPAYRQDPDIRLCAITDNKFSRTMMICFKKEKHRSVLGRLLQQFLADCLAPSGGCSPLPG